MKKLSFRGKMLAALTAFSLLLALAICVSVGNFYVRQEMSRYSDIALAYAKTASDFIDGDTVARYLETGQEDDYYQEVKHFLNSTQAQGQILYFYIYVPYEDDLVYIWDADNVEGACPLGYHENYMEGGKALSMAALAGTPSMEIKLTKDPTYGDIGSIFYPVYDSQGQGVAVAAVDLYMPNINANLLQFILIVVLITAAVIILLNFVLFRLFSKVFIRPINTLNSMAKWMVSRLEDDTTEEIQVHTGDELEELANSFNQMNLEVRDYIRQLASVTAEKERISTELSVATQIQASMLPSIFPPFPDRREFDLHASMNPAKEVGGDFYDFFLVDDDHLALVIADVSGKGVPAALFMVIAKTLLKNAAQSGLSARETLEKVNNQLCEGNEAEMFVTVWMGILEISTGKLTCANAGHEYPAIRRAGESFELLKDKHGFVLAGMEGARYRDYELLLAPGDTVFVYTDGVAEATDANEELFGTDRMLSALNQRPDAPPAQLLAQVSQAVDAFVGDAPQFDDLTMLSVQYLGNAREDR